MNYDITHLLDQALEARRPGGAAHGTPVEHPELVALLQTASLLETAVPVPLPTADERGADRTRFLAEAAALTAAAPVPEANQFGPMDNQAVSTTPLIRLIGWLTQKRDAVYSIFPQKEPKTMSSFILKAALTISLLIGSMGGTAALAANSAPNDALYPLKLQLENARMAMADDAAAQARLHLAFAAERADEMADLSRGGVQPDAMAMERLQNHLQLTLQLAAQADPDTMMQLLHQIQQMAQTQEQAMPGAGTGPVMIEAQQMWRHAGETAAAGLQDPQTFRWRNGNMPEGNPADYGPHNEDEPLTPQNQFRNGQDDTSGQYGPGYGDAVCDYPDGCEPAGDQNQHQYGQDDEIEPGQYGPGDGDGVCDNPDGCEPVGDEHQYQHGQDDETAPGQYGPGDGDGVCDNPDGCEPAGDEHQYQHGQDDAPPAGQNGPGDGDGTCDNADNCVPTGDNDQNGQNGGDNGGGNSGGTGN